MKKIFLPIILLLLINIKVDAQEVLDTYLKTAAKNNPHLKSVFNEYMASLEIVPIVGALPDPQFAFGYFISPVVTRNGPQQFKISLSQQFPWFGTFSERKDEASHRAKALFETFLEEKSRLFFKVKSLFFELHFLKKSMEVVREEMRFLETLKNLISVGVQSGGRSSVDLIRVETEWLELENNLSLLIDKQEVYLARFRQLIHVNKHEKIIIPDSFPNKDIPYTRETIAQEWRENNHVLKNFDHMIASYESRKKMDRKQGLPNLVLGADYTNIGALAGIRSSAPDAFMFKLGISIPLYRKKYQAMLKETTYRQQVTVHKKTDKIDSLSVVEEETYRKYINAKRREDLFEKVSKLARKAIDILEVEYATNGAHFEEILKMEKQYLSYSLELERAKADKQIAVAFIDYLIGK